jgi:mRNA interferase YafQ
MRTPGYTTQFEKDIKRMRKRGKDIQKLKQVLSSLIEEEQLVERFKDHPLIGNY